MGMVILTLLAVVVIALIAVLSFAAGWIYCAATDDRWDGPEFDWKMLDRMADKECEKF